MTYQRISLLFAALCFIAPLGCVPVTEPLSDRDKAGPDKRLFGKWQLGDDQAEYLEIDSPTVKGNPKGLMRYVRNGGDLYIWFFVTTIGKHTYATICPGGEDADFGKEGVFQKWQEGNNRYCVIVRYVLNGDTLTVDWGADAAMVKLMRAEKIEETRGFFGTGSFKTPPGWLATYLEKNGPQTLYDGTNVMEWRRQKK